MVLGDTSTKMENFMKVSGKMGFNLEKEFISIKMGIFMKETF